MMSHLHQITRNLGSYIFLLMIGTQNWFRNTSSLDSHPPPSALFRIPHLHLPMGLCGAVQPSLPVLDTEPAKMGGGASVLAASAEDVAAQVSKLGEP